MMSMRKARKESRNLVLEKNAWFLCKFLCRELDEDTLEKLRYHVSICKGVKTKVKLSDKGWSIGYKPSSIRHFSHKLPYEFFPLDFIENMQQDAMFVNVLLCVFRMQNLPDIQYEIVAYKFPDNASAKKLQDIFQILTGSDEPQTLRAPGSRLTLVPGRSYHMGTLSPDRWGSKDRLGNDGSVTSSEVGVNGTGNRPMNGGRRFLESEGSWSGGSSLLDDGGTAFRTSDGTIVTPSTGSTYGRPRNNITLTSMDSFDGPVSRRIDFEDSTNRRIYSKPPSDRGRTPDTMQRNRYQSTDTYSGRSRSVDPFGRDTMSPRNVNFSSGGSDIMSVRSQSSYLLSPNFKKVYVHRNAQQQSNYINGSFQNPASGPRSYTGNNSRLNDEW